MVPGNSVLNKVHLPGRTIALALLSLFLLLSFVPNCCGDEVVTVTCHACSGKTVLVSGSGLTIIDYDAGLFCVKPDHGDSRSYPLFLGKTPNDPETDFLRRRSAMAGMVEPLKPSGNGADANLIYLRFGGLMDRVKTVVTPKVGRFGREFSPQDVRLTVDPHHPQTERLQFLAQQNEKYYLSDPLLRRLDPLGLLHLAGAVVTGLESEREKVRYIYSEGDYLGDCRGVQASQR